MCNPILTLDQAQDMAAKAARVTHVPWHVVRDGMLLRIADDRDIACWQLSNVLYTVEPEQVYDAECDALTTAVITTMVHAGMSADTPPPGFPDDDDGTEDGGGPPRCLNCRNPHHTWQCPEIYALLFAPFTDVCVSCGDQLHWDAPLNTVCGACQEWADPVVMVMDVEHAHAGWSDYIKV